MGSADRRKVGGLAEQSNSRPPGWPIYLSHTLNNKELLMHFQCTLQLDLTVGGGKIYLQSLKWIETII